MQLNFSSWHHLHYMRFFTLFLLLAGISEAGTVIQQDKVPDLVLSLEPFAITEDQAAAAVVQIGLRDWRANGTYAFSIDEQNLFKVSGEYLREKLGFSFQSGRLHAWVQQLAVGAEYRLCSPCNYLDYVDVGLNYSRSFSRNLHDKLVPEENLINERRIAGADAVSAQVQTLWPIGKGAVGGSLLYDFVVYHRKLQHQKIVTGPGIGLNGHYPLLAGTRLHVNAELRRPYLFLEGRLSWHTYFWKTSMGSSLFIESVRGFQSLPSSTRFGIELSFHISPPKKTDCGLKESCCPTAAQLFARMPAVYRPQVLAIADQRSHGFLEMLNSLQGVTNLTIPVGSFAFDASVFFTGDGPFVFMGNNFPPGLSIDPLTGEISGTVGLDAVGVYAAEVVVINSTGRIVQPVMMQVVP